MNNLKPGSNKVRAQRCGLVLGFCLVTWCRDLYINAESISGEHKVVLTSYNFEGVGGWNVDLAYYPLGNIAYGEVYLITVHRRALYH